MVKPQPTNLEWAQGQVPTPQGALAVKWAQAVADGTFHMQVVSPPGTSGEVWVPLASTASTSRALTPGPEWVRRSGGYYVYRVQAGTFEFSSSPATFTSLSELVATLTAQGRVSILGAVALQLKILAAALLDHAGRTPQAIKQLEDVKRLANDFRLVRDATARDALSREVDALMAGLRAGG
jgi:hypothetical protein